MSAPASVTLVAPITVPVLTPLDWSPGTLHGLPPGGTVLLRPLLGHAMGRGHIAATVKKQEQADPAATPVARRVILLVEPTLQQVAETWSDQATGAYRFDGLNPDARFTVVAFDHLHQWRAVLADNLAPERGA